MEEKKKNKRKERYLLAAHLCPTKHEKIYNTHERIQQNANKLLQVKD
jgi:hypothetical protein